MSDKETVNSSPNIEDAELVRKLRGGEPDAVLELYNAYFDRIYSLVFNQVAKDRDAAQDIVQETFIAALKSAGRFRCQSKVYTWLCSIANKKVADFYRCQKRDAKYRRKYQNSYAVELTPTSGGETLAFSMLGPEKTTKAIQQALSNLPLHYRQVLLLKYIEEMPVLEISLIMKRSPKSIKGLLTRARKDLRAKLINQE
jgi:RNA polymerase sigma-70 factor (ECF subfamily)